MTQDDKAKSAEQILVTCIRTRPVVKPERLSRDVLNPCISAFCTVVLAIEFGMGNVWVSV